MAEPPLAKEPRAFRPLRRLLLGNLAATALIFALLECWRPLYFLTDDNLDGGFPLLTGIGRRMARGESPFVSDEIFGGHYNLLRDCTSFCWHPIYLAAALLANTPGHFFIIDLIALCFLLLAAAGFVCLAYFLRQELDLPLGDARLTLCTLSFTFSMFVLCAGSSWVNFLANHSALPWLALGILQTQWRRALGLVTFFSLHHLLGGHLAATVSNTFFLTLFAVGVSVYRQRVTPLLCWIGGYALAALILAPLLVPAAEGFAHADRSGGLSSAAMSQFSMPALLLPFSYFLGIFSSMLGFNFGFGFCQPYYAAAFASCAAAWVLVPALASRAPWRGLEILCAALVGLALLLIIRPTFASAVMLHLPLLRSMRWPFREILQLQFFLHLFLVLRPLGGQLHFQRIMIFTGIFIFVCPLFFLRAPSFNTMEADRALLFSGVSERYWQKVKALIGPEDVIVPVINPDLTVGARAIAPFSLIGAYDYPILFQVRSGTGYSLTVPRGQLYITLPPAFNSGIFLPSQEAAILQERPNVRFVTLESIRPVRITLSSPVGPAVDLTPLLTEP
jgi:hypothetical protein